MSVNQQAPAALPDPQTAYNNLFEGVHAEVFFRKLASAYGIQPTSPEQAQCLLDIAGMLRNVSQEPAVKQASIENDPFFQARQNLMNALGQHGLDGDIKQAAAQEQAVAIRNAAAALANNPLLYNSVLSLKTAEAMDVQAQLAGAR